MSMTKSWLVNGYRVVELLGLRIFPGLICLKLACVLILTQVESEVKILLTFFVALNQVIHLVCIACVIEVDIDEVCCALPTFPSNHFK